MDRNETLLACYRSGQMTERDMIDRMREDEAFADFVTQAMKE